MPSAASARSPRGATAGSSRTPAPTTVSAVEEEDLESSLVKLSLNLSRDLFEGVAADAARRRVTKTEVMRRALSVHLFLEEIQAQEGGKIEVFVRRQGTLQQVVFPWFI